MCVPKLYASGDEKDPAYDVIKLADFGLVLPPPRPALSHTKWVKSRLAKVRFLHKFVNWFFICYDA